MKAAIVADRPAVIPPLSAPGGDLLFSPAVKSGKLLSILQDAAELLKIRVALLVLFTTLSGFVMGSRYLGEVGLDYWLLFYALFGTGLVAGSASALNQVIERERDAKMDRTRDRPLPTGRLSPGAAIVVGSMLFVAGFSVLWILTNPVAALFALATWIAYVFLYTPLKPRTHLSTLVGAIPGALPPVIGWTSSGAVLGGPAWCLFGILFFWQLPHFLAIAWLYRRDYARGGFPLLTVTDPSGNAAARQSITNTLALITVSLFPTLTGQSGFGYFWLALALGLAFLALVVRLALSRSDGAARATVLASVVYLPLLLVSMVVDARAP